MLYTEPRYTKDLDIWMAADPENASRVFQALAEFGAPLAGIRAEDFTRPDIIYQLGVAPVRIDILTSLSGVNFDEAWTRRKETEFGETRVPFLGIDDLLRNKRSTGRVEDLLDCQRLEAERRKE